MNEKLKKISEAIKNCRVTNTYKMAWLRALTEYLSLNPSQKTINLEPLAVLIFQYYWNQTIYFKLKQGSNPNVEPEILKIVKDEINRFQNATQNFLPIKYLRVQDQVQVNTTKIIRVLKKDVIKRFNNDINLYDFDSNNNKIKVHNPNLLVTFADIIFELVNYRWVSILEDFNYFSPRIAYKVRGAGTENIRRGNLNKFHSYIEIENPQRLCFITGIQLNSENLSVHHVIPWSYMYSDDLWNLVYVDKNENSRLSNSIPNQVIIDKLKQRNNILKNRMENLNIRNKIYNDLKYAIDRDLVTNYWNNCRG